jgi:hypothetical protein
MVTMVLLKVERIWATPLGIFFLPLRGPVLRVGLGMALSLILCSTKLEVLNKKPLTQEIVSAVEQ